MDEGEKELTSCPAAARARARERERERDGGGARGGGGDGRSRRVARSLGAFWKKTSRLFEWRTRRIPRLLGSGFCPLEPVAQACTAMTVWAISLIEFLLFSFDFFWFCILYHFHFYLKIIVQIMTRQTV